jgi:hypothetical protein
MKICFQADADFNETIIKAILRRAPEIDFESAIAAGLPGLDDIQVLTIAARHGRLLVSHDRKTLPHHFATFIQTETSPGVVIVPQNWPIARAAEDLILIWEASEAEEWVNRICALPL